MPKLSEPCGRVRVNVIEGIKLVNKDFMGKSDPYCTVDCGDNHFKTRVKDDTLKPKWNEEFEFDWRGEVIVRIECWDEDKVKDESMGYVDFRLRDVLAQGGAKGKYEVIGANKGKLELEVTVEHYYGMMIPEY
jgi:phosphatidylserine decarboxylase